MASKRTPINAESETGSDVFENQIAKSQAAEGSHGAAIGKRQNPYADDPFQFGHDNLAGVKLLESRKHGEMLLVFEEKPSQEVINKVKEHGFRWNNQEKFWVMKIGPTRQIKIALMAIAPTVP